MKQKGEADIKTQHQLTEIARDKEIWKGGMLQEGQVQDYGEVSTKLVGSTPVERG